MFETLRHYNMKSNPNKCTFGVSSSKFLGSWFRSRALKLIRTRFGPSWIWNLLRASKKYKSLNGRVTALNRFVLRATNKCLLFFKTLKKAFEGTDDCQRDFEELKSYLSSPPLLSPLKPNKELFLYLAISPIAINSALIREEEKI